MNAQSTDQICQIDPTLVIIILEGEEKQHRSNKTK